MDNKEWLKELKQGDKVVYNAGHRNIDYIMVTVEKITPTGIIKTSDGRSWNTNGRERGREKSTWRATYYLQPFTQEIKDKLEKTSLCFDFNKVNLEKLSLDQLRQIHAIIFPQ